MYFWEKNVFPLKDLNFHKKMQIFLKISFFLLKKKKIEKEIL